MVPSIIWSDIKYHKPNIIQSSRKKKLSNNILPKEILETFSEQVQKQVLQIMK